MNYIFEYSNFYKDGDIVLIHYWYNGMITPVKILSKVKNKYEITHNIKESSIFNAPNEFIRTSEVIDKFRL